MHVQIDGNNNVRPLQMLSKRSSCDPTARSVRWYEPMVDR